MKLKDIWEKMKSKIMGKESCCEDPVVPVCCCEDPVVPEKKMVKIKKKVKKKNNWESNRKAALKRKR
jgi:hypothetical protein